MRSMNCWTCVGSAATVTGRVRARSFCFRVVVRAALGVEHAGERVSGFVPAGGCVVDRLAERFFTGRGIVVGVVGYGDVSSRSLVGHVELLLTLLHHDAFAPNAHRGDSGDSSQVNGQTAARSGVPLIY